MGLSEQNLLVAKEVVEEINRNMITTIKELHAIAEKRNGGIEMHNEETQKTPWDEAKEVVSQLYSDQLSLVDKAQKMIDACKTENDILRVLITIRKEAC